MSATILCFPGFLLADDGKGFLKDGKYHPNVDALVESLTESEHWRMLEWNRRRFPDAIRRRTRDGGGNAA